MKRNIKKALTDLIFFISGCFIYSSAVTMFISANEISPGGLTGIATTLNYLFSLPSGIMLLILNIPVIILGLIKFGGIFIIKTAFVTMLASLSLTLTDLFLPAFKIDKILAAVFGGILMGLGLSLVLLRGATTGGVDILAKFINKKFRHLTVGKIILAMDALVIAFASFTYRNVESALYSVIALYSSTFIMDYMLYGGDKGKIMYIITTHPNEICSKINNSLGRGVTILQAKGGFTGEERLMLMCIVRRHEVSSVYDILEAYDRNAFIVVGDAGEIIGEGFKPFK